MRTLLLLGCVVSSALLPGCARRAAPIAAVPTAASRDFVDLRPGWRLRVVTPLLKSGGFKLQTFVTQVSGNTVTLSDGGELQGYETAFYEVAAHPGGGVRISFASAEVTKQGVSVPQPRPVVPLFDLPPRARFVRLVFLTRISQADHDMAVLAAHDLAAVDRLAAEIQANPRACVSAGRDHYCGWIPAGIAVRAEAHAADRWDPVR